MSVGHTHTKCDQMFSCFARQLQRHPVYSLPSLVESIQSSYTPSPIVFVLHSVIDFATFAQNGLIKAWTVRNWHALRISRHPNGSVICHYKELMSHPEWLCPRDIMFVPNDWRSSPLHYVPPCLLPLSRLDSLVKKYQKFLEVSCKGVIPPVVWWMSLYSKRGLNSGAGAPYVAKLEPHNPPFKRELPRRRSQRSSISTGQVVTVNFR